MSFTDRVKVIIDVAADGAKSTLGQFKADIAAAEGPIGKVKAAGASMFDGLKSAAGPALLGAGAGLVAFGIKAVGAFTDTAKAAIDMGAATGLSTEAASRWIAVADDFGIKADQLETGLGRIGKTLDSGKWEKYGVQTRDAAGEARSANDVLIDTLDMLGKVTNATERTRIGNELFGKGYANLAPLIGKTADEYRDMLGAVEDGQVITDQEAKKAERMRLAQDALSDALGEVTLAVGELVAEMAPAIEQAAQLVGWLTKLGDVHIPGLPEEFNLMTGHITYAQEAWKVLTNQLDGEVSEAFVKTAAQTRESREELQRQREDAAAAAYGVGEYTYSVDESTRALHDMVYAQERAAETTREQDRATAALDDTLARLLGRLDVDDATAKLNKSFADMNTAVTEAFDAAANGAEDATAKQQAAEQAVRDHNRAVLEFAANVLHLPASKLIEIQAQIDQGQIAQVEADLEWLARTRSAYINVSSNYDGAGGSGGGQHRQRATGGYTGADEVTTWNEAGREVARFPDGTFVYTAREAQDLLGGSVPANVYNINVTAGLGARGREVRDAVLEAVRELNRLNGPAWSGRS